MYFFFYYFRTNTPQYYHYNLFSHQCYFICMLLHLIVARLLLPHNNYCTDPPTYTTATSLDYTFIATESKTDETNRHALKRNDQKCAYKICRYSSYRVSPRVKNSVPRNTYNRNLLVPRKKSIFPRSLTCIWQLSSNRNHNSSRLSHRSGMFLQAMGGL